MTAPIVGPKSVEQLTGLLPAGDMDLPDDIRAACDELVTPGSFVASFFNSAHVDGMEAMTRSSDVAIAGSSSSAT